MITYIYIIHYTNINFVPERKWIPWKWTFAETKENERKKYSLNCFIDTYFVHSPVRWLALSLSNRIRCTCLLWRLWPLRTTLVGQPQWNRTIAMTWHPRIDHCKGCCPGWEMGRATLRTRKILTRHRPPPPRPRARCFLESTVQPGGLRAPAKT